ncbi:MAG TPA: OFA family MFS transporter [Clostridia bacterium]|nr:OFA family MFS transporter [Clostridia bacterium]
MQRNVTIKDGWKVLFAGLCINLTLGVLYSWSVIKKALVHDWNWTNSDASLPYSVAIVVWAITLLFAGRLQDKIGPRKVVTLGAIFTGTGLILSSFIHSVPLLIITFGILAGGGIGFAYASVTPPALKWFHSSKKGMVTGIVVSGMGLASLYIAPLTTMLLENYGISRTFLVLGIFILLIATPVAQLINNPPSGYVAPTPANLPETKTVKVVAKDFSWKEMVKTKQFYFFWLMFAFASSAGLMIIGNIATIAKTQANWEKGFYLVGLLAIFNACGRLAAGFLSDKIGRVRTMMIVFVLQGVNMTLFAGYSTPLAISIGTALAGIGYGALLSLFPSVVADYYGVKNFGGNYGVLYTAWGISGIIGPIIAGIVVDRTGAYNLAYMISAGLLAVALVLALITKPISTAATAEKLIDEQVA